MEYLDLSWNHIRRKGAVEITNGLRVRMSFWRNNTDENKDENEYFALTSSVMGFFSDELHSKNIEFIV